MTSIRWRARDEERTHCDAGGCAESPRVPNFCWCRGIRHAVGRASGGGDAKTHRPRQQEASRGERWLPRALAAVHGLSECEPGRQDSASRTRIAFILALAHAFASAPRSAHRTIFYLRAQIQSHFQLSATHYLL